MSVKLEPVIGLYVHNTEWIMEYWNDIYEIDELVTTILVLS